MEFRPAGGAAIGANIGILNTADNSELGSLSADATTITPTDATAESGGQPSEDWIPRTFAVDVTATVDVEADGAGICGAASIWPAICASFSPTASSTTAERS